MREGWFTRERLLLLALLAATALALFACFLLLRPFLPATTWALALAVLSHPLHEWLSRRIASENFAAGIAVFLVCAMIVAPAIWVSDQIIEQAASVIESAQNGDIQDKWNGLVERTPWLARAVRWVANHVDFQGELDRASSNLTSRAGGFIQRSLDAALQIVILPFILFFLLRDHRAFLRGIRSLVPLSNRETTQVFQQVSDAIHAQVFGTILVSMIQGSLGGLMFWLLGLPAPVLWAVVMSVFAMAPALGTFMVWGPAALYLALSGEWSKALILVAWGGLMVGTVDSFLYPALVGKRIHLHTLLVFFAIIGGVAAFGSSGLILGPITLSVAIALVDIWRLRTAEGRAAEEAPLMR